MRNRTARIGAFALSLVLSVGAMGAAFASWTDTVVIQGDVTTGDLGYEVCSFSETWVYKEVATGALKEYPVPRTEEEVAEQGLLYVASADWPGYAPGARSECIPGTLSLDVVYDNLFPTMWFKADVVLHYTGSVPARLSPAMEFHSGSEWLQELWQTSPEDFFLQALLYDPGTQMWEEVELEGLQLEYCDTVELTWWLRIPQDDDYIDRSAGFTTTINMVQWNEYVAAPVSNALARGECINLGQIGVCFVGVSDESEPDAYKSTRKGWYCWEIQYIQGDDWTNTCWFEAQPPSFDTAFPYSGFVSQASPARKVWTAADEITLLWTGKNQQVKFADDPYGPVTITANA